MQRRFWRLRLAAAAVGHKGAAAAVAMCLQSARQCMCSRRRRRLADSVDGVELARQYRCVFDVFDHFEQAVTSHAKP